MTLMMMMMMMRMMLMAILVVMAMVRVMMIVMMMVMVMVWAVPLAIMNFRVNLLATTRSSPGGLWDDHRLACPCARAGSSGGCQGGLEGHAKKQSGQA